MPTQLIEADCRQRKDCLWVRDKRLRPERSQQFPAVPQTSCMTW